MCKLVEIKMGVYRHFKGNDYEVFDIAEHSETGETLIIYRSINRKRYCDNGIVYARPMDMFFSKVDKEKYPEATQNDRFEYIGTNNECRYENIEIEKIHEILSSECEKFLKKSMDKVAYGITHSRAVLQNYIDNKK